MLFRSCDFYAGRTVLGGSKAEQQSLWLSQGNNLFNFSLGALANDAFQARIMAEKAQDITCIFSGAVCAGARRRPFTMTARRSSFCRGSIPGGARIRTGSTSHSGTTGWWRRSESSAS